jgi:dTDP-4-amino-4,6-dideoxygalactose transaminase
MFHKKDTNGFVWAVDDFGSNYRMTEMQAAVGRSMLTKLDSWVRTRRRLAGILTEGLGAFEQVRVTVPEPEACHSYYKYYCFIKPDSLKRGWTRDRIIRALNVRGIACGTGVCPEIYLEKAFRRLSAAQGKHRRFPVARELGETSLMFQVHPTLDENGMYRIIEAMRKVLHPAAR